MGVYMIPHGPSQSGSALRAAIRRQDIAIARVDRESTRHIARRNNFYINWGLATAPNYLQTPPPVHLINDFGAVSIATNKLKTFSCLLQYPDIRIPVFYPREVIQRENTNIPYMDIVRDIEEGHIWLARSSLNGHSGEGIVVLNSIPAFEAELDYDTPLFVKYIKKMNEFRVHVFGGRVIDITEKRSSRTRIVGEGSTIESNLIRSHRHGWVFCRENINREQPHVQLVEEQALRAIAAVGLDFGAVDVIYNQRRDRAYVLEINTAPGLEGTTLEIYTNTFVNYLRELGN